MLLILLLALSSAWGQVGSVTDSLGGTSIANTHPLDSAWANPAGVAAKAGVFAGIQFHNGDVTRTTELTQYGATLTDNSTGGFPGAIGYKQRTYKVGGNKVHERVIRAAIALPLAETFVMGLAGFQVHTDPWDTEKTDQNNGDIGFIWMPIPELRVGAISRAFMGARDNVFGPSRVVPSGGVGAKYIFSPNLAVLADINYGYEDIGTGQRLGTQIGAEFVNTESVALRIGYKNDEWLGERRFTAGIGWDGPKLRAGYSYQKETKRELGESHTIDIWLAF